MFDSVSKMHDSDQSNLSFVVYDDFCALFGFGRVVQRIWGQVSLITDRLRLLAIRIGAIIGIGWVGIVVVGCQPHILGSILVPIHHDHVSCTWSQGTPRTQQTENQKNLISHVAEAADHYDEIDRLCIVSEAKHVRVVVVWTIPVGSITALLLATGERRSQIGTDLLAWVSIKLIFFCDEQPQKHQSDH